MTGSFACGSAVYGGNPRVCSHLWDTTAANGVGVHFCMGSRLAVMQLRVLWEETLARFREVEVVGAPVRVRSNFVKGYTQLPVRVHPY
jgi:cytochrome P450